MERSRVMTREALFKDGFFDKRSKTEELGSEQAYEIWGGQTQNHTPSRNSEGRGLTRS